MQKLGRAVLILTASALSVSAQSFVVASVKPCRTSAILPGELKHSGTESSPAHLRLPCQSVLNLIRWAYVNYANDVFDPLGVTPIKGAPSWLETEEYSVEANPVESEPLGILNGRMLRVLLEDRFRLKIRAVKTQSNIYALSPVAAGARLSPAANGDCTVVDSEHPPPSLKPGDPFPRLCGMAAVTANGFDAPGVTLTELARLLSDHLDRKVVDRTQFAGRFNVHLELTAPDLQPEEAPVSIRRALGKIGLRLTPAKAFTDSLVIEHVERSSEN